MIRVEARPGEPLDKTLRRFKKQCEKEGLTKDIKKNSYFEKPSERSRRKKRQAEKAREKAKIKAHIVTRDNRRSHKLKKPRQNVR